MGEVANPSIELSHPPTPPPLDIYADLDCKLVVCHVNLFSQPPFSHSVDPPNFPMSCSPIPDSTLVVHEDHVVDKVGVEEPTCFVIYDEYVWEYEEEPAVKDDFLLPTPHMLFPDIFGDSSIFYLACENPS